MSRNIMIAVDSSDHSKIAFDWCLNNIYRPDDTIIICHIPETPHLPSFSFKDGLGLPVEEWQAAIQSQLDKIRKLEENYEAELTGKKVPVEEADPNTGNPTKKMTAMKYKVVTDTAKRPGEGIINVAEREKAQMVVMGTRGLDVMRRTLLGSVSDYVVRHSSVPVVICPKPN